MDVTPETIAVALGRTAPDEGSLEFAQWQMWISDALMLIEARLGDPTELDQDKLDYVVREAVVAHVRKPDDATQVEVAIDDARSSRTYRSSKGRVTIIDEWWDLLKPSDRSAGAFSFSPFGGYNPHLPWCTLMMGGDYCSCGVNIAGHPIYELDGI
jgi:hypothetical protein